MKPIYKYLLFALAVPALASCSTDEPGVETLPEGKYPMEFSVDFAPQTRVSASDDGMSCTWNDGDKITITVTQNGQVQTATATLDANGNITDCTPTIYWTSTAPADVKAIYHNITFVRYTNQSDGLAYSMKATTTAEFGRCVQLNMEHQLAQIRMKLSGFNPEDYGNAMFYGYVYYTLDEDGFTTKDKNGRGYITMYYDRTSGYFIANVGPGRITTAAVPLFYFYNGSGDNFSYDYDIKAGQVYTFDLESEKPALKINGHEAVLMRNASGTPGSADYVPPLYFATCNVGADTPYDGGLLFWWGDTKGHTADSGFDFSKNNSEIKMFDSCQEYFDNGMLTSPLTTENVSDGTLTPEYDAAVQHYGSPWRMMTFSELQWLWTETEQELCPSDEASGHCAYVKYTSKETGNSIILPLTGFFYEPWAGSPESEYGGGAMYWCSQVQESSRGGSCWGIAYIILKDLFSYSNLTPAETYSGLSIRPVANL